MYYPEEVIEEVRMRSDIVDVISGYVKLQKKGSNLFGLCPFHHEKSPSFSVSPSKQMYHCFGCGVSGNVITFVMEYENYSFREAVEMLADRSGVKLPKMEYSKEAKAKADRKAALLEINKLAANYFYYQMKQPQGKIAFFCILFFTGALCENLVLIRLNGINKACLSNLICYLLYQQISFIQSLRYQHLIAHKKSSLRILSLPTILKENILFVIEAVVQKIYAARFSCNFS